MGAVLKQDWLILITYMGTINTNQHLVEYHNLTKNACLVDVMIGSGIILYYTNFSTLSGISEPLVRENPALNQTV